MPATIHYVDPVDGKSKVRDANSVAFVNRDDLKGVRIFKLTLNLAQLTFKDAGLIFYANDSDGLGGGDGLYFWDGSFARKIGPGAQTATIACTAGASIVTAAQRQLVMGASTLYLTAAGGVTVGTATTAPILPDGFHGQELTLHNVSSGANSITLTDVGGMALSNLKLIGATVVLAQFKALKLVFDANATAGQRWKQVAPLSA